MDDQGSKVLDQAERKQFDLHGGRVDVEATGEHPVMYKALNSTPRDGHPYNVYRDIASEPVAVKQTLDIVNDITGIIAAEMATRGISQAIHVGLPTSIFVGQVVSAAFTRHACIQSWCIDSAEFMLSDIPFDAATTAFFFYSGSGSTHDTNEAARIVQGTGAYSIAFTSIAGSPITEKCTRSIVCAGGMDTGGSDTFHYATRVAAGLLLAFKLALHRAPDNENVSRLVAELRAAPDVMAARFDTWDKRARSVARQLARRRSVLVVGGGPNVGGAEEMALKFDEMAHVPGKAMVPTRHLHGVFGLTDEHIVTVILAAPGSPHQKWLRQVAEVTTILKAPAIAVVDDDETVIADQVDYVFRVPTKDEFIYALLTVPILQLVPYHFAVADGGINPDCQRSNIPKHARAWNHVFPPGSH